MFGLNTLRGVALDGLPNPFCFATVRGGFEENENSTIIFAFSIFQAGTETSRAQYPTPFLFIFFPNQILLKGQMADWAPGWGGGGRGGEGKKKKRGVLVNVFFSGFYFYARRGIMLGRGLGANRSGGKDPNGCFRGIFGRGPGPGVWIGEGEKKGGGGSFAKRTLTPFGVGAFFKRVGPHRGGRGPGGFLILVETTPSLVLKFLQKILLLSHRCRYVWGHTPPPFGGGGDAGWGKGGGGKRRRKRGDPNGRSGFQAGGDDTLWGQRCFFGDVVISARFFGEDGIPERAALWGPHFFGRAGEEAIDHAYVDGWPDPGNLARPNLNLGGDLDFGRFGLWPVDSIGKPGFFFF